jgi:UDP-galactopyranose mutase
VPYQHRVKAQLSDGRYVTLPVNRETKEIVGEEHVLDIFFRPYTKKMWGVELDELDPSIIKRVPIRDDYNELYFPNDPFQALPVEGYTVLVRNMLFHQNITIELDKAFSREMEADYDHIFNSMPIDQYFNFSLGELPYRSIKFHEFHLPMPLALPAPVVNFTHDGPYTRVTEWKQLTNSNNNMYMTSLTFEEPCDYRDNYQERYYPVKDVSGKNRDLYHQYVELAKENEKMTFIGRCGLYVYIDIDQAIASTQATVRRFLKEQQ